MDRRSFLKAAGAIPLATLAPGLMAAAAPAGADGDRILVLVELKGGNDGLNTVVPYGDREYYRQRERLAIDRDQVHQLGKGLGLHPAMESLMAPWQARDLAVVLGVGYPDPNRSHFRSIEIWETASNSNEFRTEGWLAELLRGAAPARELTADGIVIGRDSMGPLAGRDVRALAIDDPGRFIREARKFKTGEAPTRNAALSHILDVQQDLQDAAEQLRRRMDQAPKLKTDFPGGRFARQLEIAARLLGARVPLAVIKVSHGGFDTHSGQAGQHQRLLGELAQGLAAFRSAMQEVGLWDRVLVMTYSEFGRRVRVNGSAGTDHGTAAPHFVMGGRVNGGFYGEQPSLVNLQNGDLVHTVDFRSLYATVAQRWWGVPAGTLGGAHRPLELIS